MPLKVSTLLGAEEEPLSKSTGFFVVSFVAASVFFSAAVWGDFIRFGLGISLSQPMALGGFCVAAAAVYLSKNVLRRPPQRQRGGFRLILGIFVFLFLLSVLRGFEPYRGTLAYTPIIGALLLVLDRRAVRLLVLLTLLVTFGICLFEVASHAYLFIAPARDQGFMLDEQLMAGALGAFRSKGLFAGPTSAVGFAILAFAYAPKNLVIALLCVAISLLSGSKAGLFFVSIVGALAFIQASPSRKMAIVFAASAALGLAWLLPRLGLVDTVSYSRALDFTNMGASGNDARFDFWTEAVSRFFSDWTPVEQLFGAPRSLSLEYGLSSESSVLDYLLDTGLVGFCAFFAAIWLFLLRPNVRDPYAFASRIALLVLCSVVPLISQAGLASLFWLLVGYGSVTSAQRVGRARTSLFSRERTLTAGPSRN